MSHINNFTHIKQSLSLMVSPGQVFEIRVLSETKFNTMIGYFDNIEKAVSALQAKDLTSASGVYVTLNPLKSECLARRSNRLDKGGIASADADVLSRQWMVLDFDPVRMSGISSSDDEKASAFDLLCKVHEDLTAMGFPEPYIADSGNGFHLGYRIDLPADDDGLVKQVLTSLASRYNTSNVKIDTTLGNASRICKLYGTVSRKGDSTDDRPHRVSELLTIPAEGCKTVARDLLTALSSSNIATNTDPSSSITTSVEWVENWIKRNNVKIQYEKPPSNQWQRVWVLAECPFNPDHDRGEACILVLPDGRFSFTCHHNHCSAFGWREFRAKIESLTSTNTTSSDPKTPKRAVKRERRSETFKSFLDDPGVYFDTGYPSLNQAGDGTGIPSTSCMVITADPSVGKTTWLMRIIYNIWTKYRDQVEPYLIVTDESPRNMWARLSMWGGYNRYEIKRGFADQVRGADAFFGDFDPVQYVDTAENTLDVILEDIEQDCPPGKIPLVLADSLNSLPEPSESQTRERMMRKSRLLQEFSKRTNALTMLVAQKSKATIGSTRASISDPSETIDIAYQASIQVTMISVSDDMVECHVTKSKEGRQNYL